MEKIKAKIIQYVEAKTVNKRIKIMLLESVEGDKLLKISTKRLIDYKSRDVLETSTLYTIDTIATISDLLCYILNQGEIKNKVLLKELANRNKYRVMKTDVLQ